MREGFGVIMDRLKQTGYIDRRWLDEGEKSKVQGYYMDTMLNEIGSDGYG